MPLYDYQCQTCGKVIEVFAHFTDPPPECHGPMQKLILPTAINPDIANWDAYQSPTTGKWIHSRKQRADDMARSNARPWEGMQQEQQEAARQKAYIEQKQDSKLHEAVAKAFYSMPESKRRLLSRG